MSTSGSIYVSGIAIHLLNRGSGQIAQQILVFSPESLERSISFGRVLKKASILSLANAILVMQHKGRYVALKTWIEADESYRQRTIGKANVFDIGIFVDQTCYGFANPGGF